MSFFKALFGIRTKEKEGPPRVIGEEEYKGFEIRALESKVNAEFQLLGEIEKEIDGEVRVKAFIRADRLASSAQAAEVSLAKGRQIIDEQGEGLFDQP